MLPIFYDSVSPDFNQYLTSTLKNLMYRISVHVLRAKPDPSEKSLGVFNSLDIGEDRRYEDNPQILDGSAYGPVFAIFFCDHLDHLWVIEVQNLLSRCQSLA